MAERFTSRTNEDKQKIEINKYMKKKERIIGRKYDIIEMKKRGIDKIRKRVKCQ